MVWYDVVPPKCRTWSYTFNFLKIHFWPRPFCITLWTQWMNVSSDVPCNPAPVWFSTRSQNAASWQKETLTITGTQCAVSKLLSALGPPLWNGVWMQNCFGYLCSGILMQNRVGFPNSFCLNNREENFSSLHVGSKSEVQLKSIQFKYMFKCCAGLWLWSIGTSKLAFTYCISSFQEQFPKVRLSFEFSACSATLPYQRNNQKIEPRRKVSIVHKIFMSMLQLEGKKRREGRKMDFYFINWREMKLKNMENKGTIFLFCFSLWIPAF